MMCALQIKNEWESKNLGEPMPQKMDVVKGSCFEVLNELFEGEFISKLDN